MDTVIDFDEKELLKTFKKKFNCNGNMKDHDEYGRVIQLQGDQRSNIRSYLEKNYTVRDGQIEIHG